MRLGEFDTVLDSDRVKLLVDDAEGDAVTSLLSVMLTDCVNISEMVLVSVTEREAVASMVAVGVRDRDLEGVTVAVSVTLLENVRENVVENDREPKEFVRDRVVVAV